MRLGHLGISAAPLGGRSLHTDAAFPSISSRNLAGYWLTLLCTTLLGYALLGRGWAYLGVPPIFIGEIVLVFGVAAILGIGRWRPAFDSGPALGVLALCAWGLCGTLPYLSTYGVDALRDAVIWGYSIFGFLLCAYLIAEPSRLAWLIRAFERFVPIFLIGILVVWVVARLLPDPALRWPWADVPFAEVKGGDVLVHLAGILAFWYAGFGNWASWWWLLLLILDIALFGVMDRAGMVALVGVLGLCLVLRPRSRIGVRLVALVAAAVVALAASNIRIELASSSMPGKVREVSFQGFLDNFRSLTSDVGDVNLDSTKEWRLDWWNEIIRYTIHGKYFWTGKGFGVNLADDDGFQVMDDHSLRTPHCVHMTILARMGVPGLALWAFAHLSWAAAMLAAHHRARRGGQRQWAGLFLFLLAYWLAFLINGSFDVFIEGPMGGIWFWTIFGAGLGAVWIYRRYPEVLAPRQPQGMPT